MAIHHDDVRPFVPFGVACVLAGAILGFTACSDGNAGAAAVRVAASAPARAHDASSGAAASPSSAATDASDQPHPPSLRVPGFAVLKLRTRDDGLRVALVEKLAPLGELGPGVRRLVAFDSWGAPRFAVRAAEGQKLIDFALHPSGEISAVFVSGGGFLVARFGADGAPKARAILVDDAVATDPFYAAGPQAGTGAPDVHLRAPTNGVSVDSAAIGAVGEDVAIAVRTSSNSVTLYRYELVATEGEPEPSWVQASRTLVEPGLSIALVSVHAASFDVFGQVTNPLAVFLDVDAEGSAYVGVPAMNGFSDSFAAHAAAFGEELAPKSALETQEAPVDVLLTKVSRTGARVFSRTAGTPMADEVHGLRVIGGRVLLVGRTRRGTTDKGTWDPCVIAHDATTGDALFARALDVGKNAVLFDVATLGAGATLAVGSAAWTQNPQGESISEAAQKWIVRLDADGNVVAELSVASGARHNELRSISPNGGGFALGGFENGPGTHSADDAPALLFADGWIGRAAP